MISRPNVNVHFGTLRIDRSASQSRMTPAADRMAPTLPTGNLTSRGASCRTAAKGSRCDVIPPIALPRPLRRSLSPMPETSPQSGIDQASLHPHGAVVGGRGVIGGHRGSAGFGDPVMPAAIAPHDGVADAREGPKRRTSAMSVYLVRGRGGFRPTKNLPWLPARMGGSERRPAQTMSTTGSRTVHGTLRPPNRSGNAAPSTRPEDETITDPPPIAAA